ncbi:MAG: methyltransferase domain-containing protein [Pseudomonadota bacterium]
MKNLFLSTVAVFALGACSGETPAETQAPSTTEAAPETSTPTDATPAPETALQPEVMATDSGARLDSVLASQPEAIKARYGARNPKATLEFLKIEPGMTVVEVLPGNNGWYTGILMPYLGSDGTLVGVDYDPEMWAAFGGFVNEEFLEARRSWAQSWTKNAGETRGEDDAAVKAFAFGNMPAEMAGTADAVLMIRALHHLNRFEEKGGFLTSALEETSRVLKPGGFVGVVQHRGPEGNEDSWATGDQGYVKQSAVITAFTAAGFELVDQSEINANPKDQPSNEDRVWRLPPTLGGSADNEELKAQMTAIGESDRMTLLFRKTAL